VRKNRQFMKDIKIVVQPNESYSSFTELNENGLPASQTIDEPEEDDGDDDKDF